MFVKRDDGLKTAFLPFDIAGLLLAAWWTIRCGVRGGLAVPAFLGWFVCGWLAAFVTFYFIVWLISLTVSVKKPAPEENHPFYRAIVVWVIGQLCRMARVRIHCIGTEKLPEERFLIVSNHRSAYDPISTVWALRKWRLSIVTKPENLRIPIAGSMIYQSNYLPIDRSNPREAMKTIQIAARLLENDVTSVGIYPEGTRNRAPENGLLPFHNGVFKIAQKANAPLVVAAITGTESIKARFPWKHTDVFLRICEVIPADELGGSTAEVSERVRAILEAALSPEAAALT